MIMPWATRAWKLNGEAGSLDTIKTTTQTLLDRFEPKAGCNTILGYKEIQL